MLKFYGWYVTAALRRSGHCSKRSKRKILSYGGFIFLQFT